MVVTAGFPRPFVSLCACQRDGKPVIVSSVTQGDERVIHEGALSCTACGETYRIAQGILDFLSHQSDLTDSMRAEVTARDHQAADYDRRLAGRHEKEIPSTLKRLGDQRGKMLIEYGCGTGRLTTGLSAKGVLAVDYSLASLTLLGEKLNGNLTTGRVRADVSVLRVQSASFDLALAAQVLEHFPSEAVWNRFLTNVRHALRPNGTLVASVYHFDLRRRLRRLPQSGHHGSGIFFHYFKPSELRSKFRGPFASVRIECIDIDVPLLGRFRLTPAARGKISRAAERVPGLRSLGHLLLVTARQR